MNNIPELKLGIISVSRDCFPISLATRRRDAVVEAYKKKYGDIYNCGITVESEVDMLKAVDDIKKAGVNSLVVYLGNFGPETPETLIGKYYDGPIMHVAAAEEDTAVLKTDRGDAYCGLLNCSYNLGMRNLKTFMPEYPVGTAEGIADMITDFAPVATALIGIKDLKIITFGPRPQEFFACNAPIKSLFDLGVEIRENSELDLLVEYKKHDNDPRIPAKIAEMKDELGDGVGNMEGILPRLAQYELTLLDVAEEQRGAKKYVAFANKCWPAFTTEFGFMPCYVNSRLTAMGMPVSCEVDIYGTLSEYIGTCITGSPVTLLDINNSVPDEIFDADIKGKFNYTHKDTFMGFHCGNTPSCLLVKPVLNYSTIFNRGLEGGGTPDITRGTLESDIKPGDITFFRLQATADGHLRAYVAQGEVLPVPTHSYGSIGIFAIPEMGRFYRYALLAKRFPHHGAVAFGHYGKALYALFDYLGIEDISYNRPATQLYPNENPFK